MRARLVLPASQLASQPAKVYVIIEGKVVVVVVVVVGVVVWRKSSWYFTPIANKNNSNCMNMMKKKKKRPDGKFQCANGNVFVGVCRA